MVEKTSSGEPKSTRHPLLPDQEPITAVENDRYGLRYAAFYLTKVISEVQKISTEQTPSSGANASLDDALNFSTPGHVIAVNAPWGAGKSSLINLLRLLYEGHPIEYGENQVVFKPLSDQKLAEFVPAYLDDAQTAQEVQTLKTLSNHLNSKKQKEDTEEDGGLKSVRFIEFNAWREETGDGIIKTLLDDIILEVFHDNAAKRNKEKFIRTIRNSGVRGVNNAIAIASVVAGTVGAFQEGDDATFGDASLSAQNKKIEKDIDRLLSILKKNEKGHLVVVIDDIDRMPPNRIQDLIIALRWIRKLPNVTFLLLFDHIQVVDSLARTMFAGGDHNDSQQTAHQFLEKIIQYNFRIPGATSAHLRSSFTHSLAELKRANNVDFAPRQFGTYKQGVRWPYALNNFLMPMLTTPRAVNRLITTLRFSIPMKMMRKIDLTDLILIEALQLFRPKTFAHLERLSQIVRQTGNPLNAETLKTEDGLTAYELDMLTFLRLVEAPDHKRDKVKDRLGFGYTGAMDDFLLGNQQTQSLLDSDIDRLLSKTNEATSLSILQHYLNSKTLETLIKQLIKTQALYNAPQRALRLKTYLEKMERDTPEGPTANTIRAAIVEINKVVIKD